MLIESIMIRSKALSLQIYRLEIYGKQNKKCIYLPLCRQGRFYSPENIFYFSHRIFSFSYCLVSQTKNDNKKHRQHQV
jgi:hypothetical protein